jgi:hypothetical protein
LDASQTRRRAIEFLFDFLIELVAEIVLSLGWEATTAPFRRERLPAALAAIGYFILGAALGAFSAWIFPYRFTQSDALSILGVIANPIAAGLAMRWYGAARRKAGKSTTNLATFVGGASFALGVSLSRFLLIIVWNVF